MKKWSMILGAVLLTGGILGACSEKETKEQSTDKPADNSAEETTEKPAEEETTTQSPEPAKEPAEEPANNEDKQPAEPKEPAADITEATGVFNGMADPHTVEIEVKGQPQSFQVAPDSEMMKKFDQMEEGTEVTFTYKKEGEQLILQELKNVTVKKESDSTSTMIQAKGVFNGIADPHTVEVKVDGQPQSFQVTPNSDTMKKFDQMEEGTEITFTYKKEGEQLILQELKAVSTKDTNTNTEAKGTFNGLADPHTVEIEVDGQPQSFQVAPDSEMMKKFDKMEEGTEVTFTYKKEGEQLILQELK